MDSLVTIIAILFFIPSVVYGYTIKKFENHKDVVKAMAKSMSSLGSYYVLVFFCSSICILFFLH